MDPVTHGAKDHPLQASVRPPRADGERDRGRQAQVAISERAATRTVHTKDDFGAFLEQLHETERLPVVAVSQLPDDSSLPPFPVELFEQEIGDSAHIWILEPAATFWLTDEIGKRLSVHSGWVRVYPSDASWQEDERRSPLLQARPDRRRWLRAAIEAVLDVAYRDGFRPLPSSLPTTSVRDVVTVIGVLNATQALVKTSDRRQAAMRTHHLWPGLPADRLVAVGQRLPGTVSAPGALLADVVPDRPSQDVPARVAAFVGDGLITLARVRAVERGRAELLLHPEFAVVIEEENEDLRALVRRDEAVTVEIVPMDGAFLASFSSEEPGDSISVFPDGPPWLIREVGDVEDVPPAAPDEPDPAGTSAEHYLTEVIDRLERQLQLLENENRMLRRAQRERSRITIPRVYNDPVEQLRLELHLAYLSRVSEGDRAKYSWPSQYSFGSRFVESLDRLVMAGGITREKIIEVCVEVLCGLAVENRSRAVKEWLEARHGRPLVRPDGATAWRVRLQNKSNAARRLRYWRHPAGEIEFDWVGVHDEELR